MTGELLASGPDPDGPRRSWRRSWLLRGLALVAVATAAVVVGPDLVSSGGDPPVAGRRPLAGSSGQLPPPVALSWPGRGPLAKDRGFTGAALARVRTERRQIEHLLYAGPLPDGSRLALVAMDRHGPQPTGVPTADLKAVVVPPGGRLDQAPVVSAGTLTDAPLTGWAGRGTDGEVYAVLVSSPKPLRARLSARVAYRPDGSATRSWTEVRGRDGTAVLAVPSPTDPSLFARWGNGPADLPVEIVVGARATPRDLSGLAISGLSDGRYAGPTRPQLLEGLLEACRPLIDVSRADVRVLWSGSLDSFSRSALLRVRRPDGPAFQVLIGIGPAKELLALGPERVPWKAADTLPWLFDSGDPSKPMPLINPSGAGVALVGSPGDPARRVVFAADGVGQLGVGSPTTPVFFNVYVDVRRPNGSRVVRSLLIGPSTQDTLVLDL